MKVHIYLFFMGLSLVLATEQASEPALTNLTDWYVDAVNGDDENGTGSEEKPFKSIHTLLAVNDEFPGFVGADDTIYLAPGKYQTQPVEIDIPNIKIAGSLDENGRPGSVLGDLTITANEVALMNCLFLDAELVLLGAESVVLSDNWFSGTTKNSLSLLGSSNNTIRSNYFESATKSCVVINFDSENEQPSNNNVFEFNYFTHHREKSTEQIILANSKSSLFKSSPDEESVSTGNRFSKCVFEEIISGSLGHVIVDGSSWKTVEDRGPSLIFEDCYFKKGDRRVPFISFLIIRNGSNRNWYWDELLNETWVTSNDSNLLTGSKKNDYTPSIQFSDGDGDGLYFETKYPLENEWFGQMSAAGKKNQAPVAVDTIEDIAVYRNAEPIAINLFDVFEDDRTADEDLTFTVSCDNESLVNTQLENGLLTLSYAEDEVGMALIKLSAHDNDSVDPKSTRISFHIFIVEKSDAAQSDRNSWYVDSAHGSDDKGTGDKANPFKSVERAFAAYAEQSKVEGAGGVIRLKKGIYGSNGLEVDIPGLSIEGTLDKNGKPVTTLGETKIIANDVKLTNCKFADAGLTLSSVENVLISNNLFTGSTSISLAVIGSSNNTIQYNEFSSAIYDCVHIYWDPESRKSSDDNLFLRNYFTHRKDGTTQRVIRVYWLVGDNASICARNRFVKCAFVETVPQSLLRVVDDENTWWMVADYKYSTSFEDCYFKSASRDNPFSEFVVLKGHPDYAWRWDELINDEWVSTNEHWGLTGDHSGWNHRPRMQFIDNNENGKVLETTLNAGLKSTN